MGWCRFASRRGGPFPIPRHKGAPASPCTTAHTTRTNPPTRTPNPLPSTHKREGTGVREVGCPDVKRSSPDTPPPAHPAPPPTSPAQRPRAAGANSESPTAGKPATYE
ncbi:hypothetical protein GCM10009864_38910 [Streptomyces lunalinharesii]|uniref:Uncharacterized protein n=1 Tax=Streptomyces lunalinharesii TaxID=333384 RepID=A0ABN3S1S5_9ACTN